MQEQEQRTHHSYDTSPPKGLDGKKTHQKELRSARLRFGSEQSSDCIGVQVSVHSRQVQGRLAVEVLDIRQGLGLQQESSRALIAAGRRRVQH